MPLTDILREYPEFDVTCLGGGTLDRLSITMGDFAGILFDEDRYAGFSILLDPSHNRKIWQRGVIGDICGTKAEFSDWNPMIWARLVGPHIPGFIQASKRWQEGPTIEIHHTGWNSLLALEHPYILSLLSLEFVPARLGKGYCGSTFGLAIFCEGLILNELPSAEYLGFKDNPGSNEP